MKASRRFNRRWVLVVPAVLALCVATATFGQSSNGNNGQALGLGNLKPALEVLSGSNIDPNTTASVIVQFLEDEVIAGPISNKKELKAAAKAARKQAIIDAGGIPELEYDNFPFSKAKLTYGALQRLVRHLYVTHVSIDHRVNGNLYTTARAVGADQVWAGSAAMPAFAGTGVTVAVLDSGMNSIRDLSGQVLYRKSWVGYTSDDLYGHGMHVGGIITGTGNLSEPGTAYPVQHKGMAPGSRVGTASRRLRY